MKVPDVPSVVTQCVIRPWVSRQISGPVVARCAPQLAGLLY